MYSLVKFDNEELSIIPSKRIKIIRSDECRVKVSGATYRAKLLNMSDSENDLICFKDKFVKKKTNSLCFSTPKTSRSRIIKNPRASETVAETPSSNVEQKSSENLAVDTNILEIMQNDSFMNLSLDTVPDGINESISNDSIGLEIEKNICHKNRNTDPQKKIDNSILQSVNESNKDSDYIPEPSTSTGISQSNLQTDDSSILSKTLAPDIRQIEIPSSRINSKYTCKKHFCLYCKSLQTKFARHLILKHKNEEEVKKIIHLPVKCNERKKLIEIIRKKGDFMHNTNQKLNTGTLVLCRRRQETQKKQVDDYVVCKKCKGFFSKATFRIHYNRCDKSHTKGGRGISAAGRRLAGYIHSDANDVLRRIVYPVLRDDEVSRSIKYDHLIILYANKLCDKYTLDHQHDMIRAHLRLLGRFKLQMIKIDKTVTDFISILKPQKFDFVVAALRVVANWDSQIMWFKTPAVAQNLTSLIKKVANKLRSESIKMQNYEQKKDVEDFLLLWEEEIPVLINKKAIEDQTLQKRQKKVTLPTKQDIKLLYDYLKKQACFALEILERGFDISAWKLLIECTLIMIQIFNRRRAGEIERLKLIDYEHKKKLDENINKDLYEHLSKETKEYAQQFYRLTVRGKLTRTVPVLLSPFVTKCLDIQLTYRKAAGIKDDNEYVFCTTQAGHLKKKYIRACPLMRRFANECGAFLPNALRGTTLRKHIATFTAMLDIEETQIDRLANFMGHHKDVHKGIYRVPVPVAEMTEVSRLLTAAMGGDEEENDDDATDEEQNSDSSDEENDNPTYSVFVEDTNKTHASNSKPFESAAPSTSTSISSRKRSTSPKERKWLREEKEAVRLFFGDLKKLSRLPSDAECQRAINTSAVLRSKRPLQLKMWIDNQRKAATRRRLNESSDEDNDNLCGVRVEDTSEKNPESSTSLDTSETLSKNTSGSYRKRSTSPYGKTKRRAWSQEEKEAVRAFFGDVKKLSRLPSGAECQQAINTYAVLSSRGPLQLKTWIDNQRKSVSRREAYYASKK